MAPASYEELADVLRGRLPKLAGGQRRIAHLVLADPEGTAFRGIPEAAGLAGVNESSLARFADSLGLAGYPALMELCRIWLAERAEQLRRAERTSERDGPGGLLGATAEHDQRIVARTFARIDRASWLRVAELLAYAPSVHVIGLRHCFPMAGLLTHLLHSARPKVRQLAQNSLPLEDELRDLTEGEVLVALSIRRYSTDTVSALAYAKQRALHTIALTDNAASPLAEHADVTLYVETAGVASTSSLTGFTALVQALATEVALRLR